MTTQALDSVEIARAVLQGGCYAVPGHELDVQTANAIVTVHDALRDPTNRRKLAEMPLETAARVCWRLVT